MDLNDSISKTIKELLSINIGSELIKSVVDPENFLNKLGNKKPIQSQSQTFIRDSKNEFEKILEDTMKVFDSCEFRWFSIIRGYR